MAQQTALEQLAAQLGKRAMARQFTIATAESCTGGGVAEAITRIAGSSQWFDRAFISYSNAAKIDMLDVKEETLKQFGAVSEQTAGEMACGALRYSLADITVSITGIAGPAGGSELKPVGTVCLAWADRQGILQTTQVHFSGDRHAIRLQSCIVALQGLLDRLAGKAETLTDDNKT